MNQTDYISFHGKSNLSRVLNKKRKSRKIRPTNQMKYHWKKFVIEPYKEECFTSWLARQARKFGLSSFELISNEIDFWHDRGRINKKFSVKEIIDFLKYADIIPIEGIFVDIFRFRGVNIDFSSMQLVHPQWWIEMNKYEDNDIAPPIRKEMVYCLECWKNEELRYFRVSWRSEVVVLCELHKSSLVKYCKKCGKKAINILRGEFSENNLAEELLVCRYCNSDLQASIDVKYTSMDLELQKRIIQIHESGEYIEILQGPTKVLGIPYSENAIHFLNLVNSQFPNNIVRNPIVNLEIGKLAIIQFVLQYVPEFENIEFSKSINFDFRDQSIGCIINRCDKRFKKSNKTSSLRKHIQTHFDSYPFECEKCDHKSKSNENMRTHIFNVHSDEYPYPCNKCDFKGKSQRKLDRHFKYKHNDDRPFPCPECDYAGKIKEDLTQHKLYHSDERNYPCEECDYAAKTSGDLIQHNNYIHNEERPHECEFCDYAGKLKANLDAHMYQVHSDEYKFECEICQEKIKTKDQLMMHYRSYHIEEKPELAILCSICKENMIDQYTLTRHLPVHDNDNFRCRYCEAPFDSDFRLTYHLDLVHQEKVLKDIQIAIDKLKGEGSRITYLEVARFLEISRTMFAKSPYSDLFREENDLRVDYFSLTKLPEAERIPKQLKLIEEAIGRLNERDEYITQSSVAREMGVNRAIFHHNQEFYDLIERHRTGKGGFNIEILKEQVVDAIEVLKKKKISIGYKSVAKHLGMDKGTLSQKDEIREIIEANRVKRVSGTKIELENVKAVVKELRDKGKSISQTKIIKKLRTSWNTISKDQEIIDYIQNEIQKDEVKERNDFITELEKVLARLGKDVKRISYRKVGRELGVDVHKILNDNGFKDLVDRANEKIENKKKNMILDAIRELKKENQKITFLNIKRKTGLPRSYIESDEIRGIIEEENK